jgi:hypothetical protein
MLHQRLGICSPDEDQAKARVKSGREFHWNIEQFETAADHLRIEKPSDVQIDQQGNILRAANEELHRREIMRF